MYSTRTEVHCFCSELTQSVYPSYSSVIHFWQPWLNICVHMSGVDQVQVLHSVQYRVLSPACSCARRCRRGSDSRPVPNAESVTVTKCTNSCWHSIIDHYQLLAVMPPQYMLSSSAVTRKDLILADFHYAHLQSLSLSLNPEVLYVLPLHTITAVCASRGQQTLESRRCCNHWLDW